MSVSTEYFDYVFAARDVVPGQLDKAASRLARLERKQAKLEALIENKAGAKRLRRLDKLTGRIDATKDRVDALTAEVSELNSVELPKDEVSFSSWSPVDGISGVSVTITDSPYDDSFVGGEGNQYVLRGTSATNGFRTAVGIDADFADGTDTFGFADSTLSNRLDGSFDVVAYLAGPGTSNFAETIV